MFKCESQVCVYLVVPLCVAAAVFFFAALALVGKLGLGGVVFGRRYCVGSLGNLHCFGANFIRHSHCKVLPGGAGKDREKHR